MKSFKTHLMEIAVGDRVRVNDPGMIFHGHKVKVKKDMGNDHYQVGTSWNEEGRSVHKSKLTKEPTQLKLKLKENAIYVGSRVAKKGLLGTKYGSATPSRNAGHHTVKWDNGKSSEEHHSKLKALTSMQKGYWDNKGGPPKHLEGKIK